MVSEEHVTCFGWANTQDMDDIVALTLRINDFLTGLFLGVGITLVDFKIEFGRLWENEEMRIVLADEISPDSCRLWDLRAAAERSELQPGAEPGPMADVYQELARRLGVMPSNVTHVPAKPTIIN